MGVKLAFSTNAFTRFELPEALRLIAQSGYRGVEILGDVPHAYPPEFGREAIDRLRKSLAEWQLEVSNFNANTLFGYWTDPPPEPFFEPSLISDDLDLREARQEMILLSLEIAAEIGAPCISITTGKPLGEMEPERAGEVLEGALAVILKRADALDVNVGIECEPGLLIERSDELVAWITRMNSPRLGANLDLGHSVVAGEDPVEAIRLLAGRIWNIHIEDIRGRKHYHRIPGEGDMDFSAIAAALNAVGYDRWATVELYTQAAQPERAARLSKEVLGPIFA